MAKTKNKIITFLGEEYVVSEDVKYVAVDDGGAIWGYESEPTWSPTSRMWMGGLVGCGLGYLLPEDTLTEV